MSPLCQHSTVANVEIVTGAGASLVTLCPNELYAKQILDPGHTLETQQKQKTWFLIYINTKYLSIKNLYFIEL